MRIPLTRRTATVLAAAIGLTAPLMLAGAPAAAGTGKFFVVSSGSVGWTGTAPSIARFGASFEVVWVAKTGSTFGLRARILNAAGKPLGGQVSVLSGWQQINPDPAIVSYGGQRLIAFSGIKTGSPSPYDNGAEYYLTSTDGKSWSLSTGSLSAGGEADRAVGTAVTASASSIITGFAVDDGVRYHVGVSSVDPAPGTDPITTTTGNYASDPGVGVDAKSHQAYALWYSNNSGGHKVGVWAQQIEPTLGTAVRAPGSALPSGQDGHAVAQNLTPASRAGGGVYTAYVTPKGTSIDVWKVGAAKPFATIKDSKGPTSVVVAAAPAGRIWLYWRDFSGGWRATRSNRAATRFGPSTYVPVASADIEGLFIAGNGLAGPLEAIATLTTPKAQNQVVARQILPRLSIKAGKRVARGGKLVVKVTDAGDAVRGAKVSVDGVSGKTNKKGAVTLKIPHHAATGKHRATAKVGGYAAASTMVLVTG